MARSSLSGLSLFLNRCFSRIEIPFEKSHELHILYAAFGCLGDSPHWVVHKRITSVNSVGKKEAIIDQQWAIPIHAPMRHVTGIPVGVQRIGGMAFSTQPRRCYAADTSIFH